MNTQNKDYYTQSANLIKEPPTSFFKSLRYLGPSLILSASIVGAGELISTTALGAQAGFITLWIIIISCLVKVTLQLEFGKNAINTGETTLVSLNKLPGPKLRDTHISIWLWIIIMTIKFIQWGGIIGGIALALNILVPAINVGYWAWITAISAALLVFRGHYRFIQNGSIVFIFIFTIFNIIAVALIQYTPYAISSADILSGLSFQLPGYTVVFAMAAFGLTGVGGDEIIQYPYWCIEKGYAAYTGIRDNTPEWTKRAKGWIKVMYLDALISMVIYTIVTVSFYLMGAAILHGRGEIPKGYDMVITLSKMYTETLGAGSKYIFVTGAVVALFSTLFSGLAAWARTWGDAFGRLKIIDYFDMKQRDRFIAIFPWVCMIICVITFFLIKQPVIMVALGGIASALLLLIVVYAAIHYRYKRLAKELKPSVVYDILFWLSAFVILGIGVKALYSGFLNVF